MEPSTSCLSWKDKIITPKSQNIVNNDLEMTAIYGPRRVCEQQRRRLVCASAQTVHRLYYSLFGKYRIISKLATSYISIFWLISETEQTGLNLTLSCLSETRKTGFVATRPNYNSQTLIPKERDTPHKTGKSTC